MSLRNKMLLAVIGSMTLVVSLLTLNLWVDAVRRVQDDQARMGELLRRVVQDRLLANKNLLQDIDSPEGWAALTEALSRSTLFRDWFIVDENLRPVAANAALPDPLTLTDDKALRDAIHTGTTTLTGGELTAPLLAGSDLSHRMAVRLTVHHLPISGISTLDSFQTVFVVMALGTILLILNVYILLRGIVLRPLEDLVEASRRVAQGDYSRRIPEPPRFDEVAQLIKAFNTMIDRIQEYQRSLESRIQEATDRIKGTQKQLVIAQRLSATGTLAAGIAHEINNPLGGLLNAARALRRDAHDDPKQREYLDLIIDGLDRIQGTVRQILQFSPRQLNPQPVSLPEVLSRAAALLEHKIERKGVALSNRLPSDFPPVFGDTQELQQVFLNLLMNALEAVASGAGAISIQGEVRGGECVVTIEDNGIGMTEEEMSRAFDLFFTTKDVGEGTGLGLAVVHTLVENHGGKVSLDSVKGRGTRAIVTLPILTEERRKREATSRIARPLAKR
ncbi:MAG: HAMP domain-containing histidine kinase [Planctomycetes bacterium]|nr:HAMP domain-containing histidine kinase [Planctomycetota bacterium]